VRSLRVPRPWRVPAVSRSTRRAARPPVRPITTPAADFSLTKLTTGAAIAARVEHRWKAGVAALGSSPHRFVERLSTMSDRCRRRACPGWRQRRRVAPRPPWRPRALGRDEACHRRNAEDDIAVGLGQGREDGLCRVSAQARYRQGGIRAKARPTRAESPHRNHCQESGNVAVACGLLVGHHRP
jgi:hypothetical protein